MRAGSVALALAGLLLAGCASPPLPEASSSAGPGTSGALAAPGAAHNATLHGLNATTSALHLWEPPLMGLTVANHTIATPKGATYSAQSFTWNTTFRSRGQVRAADVDLWLRVTASQAQAGSTDPGCTVAVLYTFVQNGTARNVDGGCGSAGLGVVPPGDHEIRFGAPPTSFLAPINVWPRDGVTVTLTLYTANTSLGPTCYILETPTADSLIDFVGLNETVPAR